MSASMPAWVMSNFHTGFLLNNLIRQLFQRITYHALRMLKFLVTQVRLLFQKSEENDTQEPQACIFLRLHEQRLLQITYHVLRRLKFLAVQI